MSDIDTHEESHLETKTLHEKTDASEQAVQSKQEDNYRYEFGLILFDTKLNDEVCDVIKYSSQG